MSGVKDEIGEKARDALRNLYRWSGHPDRNELEDAEEAVEKALEDRDRLRQRVAELEAQLSRSLPRLPTYPEADEISLHRCGQKGVDHKD